MKRDGSLWGKSNTSAYFSSRRKVPKADRGGQCVLVEWPPRTPVFYDLERCLSCLRLISPRRGGTITSIGTSISATGGGQRDWQGFEMDDSYSVLVCGLLLSGFQQAASGDGVRFPSTSSGRGPEGFQRAIGKPFGNLRIVFALGEHGAPSCNTSLLRNPADSLMPSGVEGIVLNARG